MSAIAASQSTPRPWTQKKQVPQEGSQEDHVAAHGHVRDAFADRLDDACALVAEDGGQRVRRGARDHVPVAVADAARRQPNGYFAGSWLGELDLLDAEGPIGLPQDGGAHGPILRPQSGTLARVRVQAAVLWEPGRPVEILDVELAPPQEGEALVRVAACGVCASDLHVVDGDLPEPLPIVLGHEASGVVVDTGPDVERVRPGDHVVLALAPSCGECESCRRGRPNFCELGDRMAATGTLADGTSRLSVGGRTLHHFNSVSSFAEYAVVPESVAVPIRQDVALDTAALVGCAALTGWGAVTRTAAVEPETSVAVWGCGGVGLSVVQAARLAGAAPIVAVDVRAEKLELATRLGATATVAARPTADTARRVRDATGGGADYAFEAIGREETIREAWEALRPGRNRGGGRPAAEGRNRHDRHVGLHQREDDQRVLSRLGKDRRRHPAPR